MNFLNKISKENIGEIKFPLQEILENSLFYPSSGFDGGVVKDCNTLRRNLNISSFIYCDFAIGDEKFLEGQSTFIGYNILCSRKVELSELIPKGWNQEIPPNFYLKRYHQWKDIWKKFARWTILERDALRDESHGPNRFSLLYLGGEGVATYQALYWTNKTYPKALAIIQPGTGFGYNWTDFSDENEHLAWVVNNNNYGQPEIVYYGGVGDFYHFHWKEFQQMENGIIRPYYRDKDGNGFGEVRIFKRV